jgi:hypothetical protein
LRRTVLVPLCAAALLLALGDAQAQWKWREANGRIQFSDRPPPASVPERDILQRPAAARAAAAAAAALAPASAPAGGPAVANAAAAPGTKAPPADPELERRRKAEEQEKAAKAKADEERRKLAMADNCQRARSAVATYESGQRIARVNDKGEREFLDDRQRADELRRAREIAASDCR